jgi:hypothetical protein
LDTDERLILFSSFFQPFSLLFPFLPFPFLPLCVVGILRRNSLLATTPPRHHATTQPHLFPVPVLRHLSLAPLALDGLIPLISDDLTDKSFVGPWTISHPIYTDEVSWPWFGVDFDCLRVGGGRVCRQWTM